MARYIDADAELVRVERLNLVCGSVIKEFLTTAKTADVVEVVRCGECKWWKSNFTWNGKEVKVCVKEPYEPVRTDDFFCADGERREDDRNG